MNFTCSKCNKRFDLVPEMIFKRGPIFTYIKCISCGKISAVKNDQLASFESHFADEQNHEKNRPIAGEYKPVNNTDSYSKEEINPSISTSDLNNNPMSQFNYDNNPGIAFTITLAARQQLYDLGYSRQDVDGMKPQMAQEIIKFQITKPAIQPAQNQQKTETPGWLVVHDETVKPQIFDLKEGKNIIGRKSSMSVDIPIETEDLTMSRRHCVVEIILNERRGEFDFLISDLKAVNGTILNGRIQ